MLDRQMCCECHEFESVIYEIAEEPNRNGLCSLCAEAHGIGEDGR